MLELDGPLVASYAWQRQLVPLSIPENNLLPSVRAQGRYNGRLYAVAAYDSGLALYVRPSLVRAAGARLPTSPAEAWTLEEFEALLRALRRGDADGAVLDLKRNYRGEWYTYAFWPCFLGAGVLPESLHTPEAWRVAETLQAWERGGFVDANVDDAAFTQGRVALSWAGHWEYSRYRRAWAGDLQLVPLPNFGVGSRTSQGSWCWGSTSGSPVARRFLQFLIEDEQVLEITAANGAVPATHSGIARSAEYRPGGALHLFAQQLTDGTAQPRPVTPAYPIFTSLFQRAVRDILSGSEPAAILQRTAYLLRQDQQDNRNYPP